MWLNSCSHIKDQLFLLFGTTQDMTERKETEQNLLKSNSLYMEAERMGKLGHWEWDHVDDKMTSCSENLARIYDMSRDEAVTFFSKPYSELDIIHPNDRKRYQHHQNNSEKRLKGTDIEFRIVTPTGNLKHIHQRSEFILDDQREIIKSYGLEQDISERKNTGEALRKSLAYYDQAEKIGKLGYWEWDQTKRCLISCSAQYADLLGTSVNEMLNQYARYEDDLVLVHPDDRQRYDDMMEEYQHKKVWMDIEYRIINRRGEEIYVREVGEPELDEDGEIVRTFGTLQDITYRRKMEKEIQEHQDNLEAEVVKRTAELMNKNRELEAFAHSVSHDLKAPLRSIEGYAHILKEDYENVLEKTSEEYLSSIADSAVRMGNMVDDLLAHAGLGQDFRAVTEIDLCKIVDKVQRDLRHDIEEQEAQINIEGKALKVNGHVATLEALMRNVISNSIKYVRSDMTPQVLITMSETDDEYIVAVKDNGIGIAKEHQDKIFGIFERLHPREEYQGTGIGLAIVEKAVQLHEGRFWLESKPGKGTTFYFSLAKNISNHANAAKSQKMAQQASA